jgi:hypothetical protein
MAIAMTEMTNAGSMRTSFRRSRFRNPLPELG